jgi:folate-binding protein YgfZ
MFDHDAFAHDLAALLQGRGFVDLSDWRKVIVSSADAVTWLHDLLTADIEGLVPGTACRSLLLTPTGRIRADVQVLRRDEDLVVVQAPDQPEHIGLALSPYVLSSDVSLQDATDAQALLAIPGAGAAVVGLPGFAPSALGPGVDLLPATGKPAWRAENALVKSDLVEVSHEAADAWRVISGIARMGADFDTNALPAEVGLEWTIDTAKGCFLGQESVAKIRNLGHPPRVLRHVRSEAPFVPGSPVFAEGEQVGTVTSAAPLPDSCVGLASVRWSAAATRLADMDGRSMVDITTEG